MSSVRQKILVSGSSGMLGKALLTELHKSLSYEIYCVSKSNSRSYDYVKLIAPDEIEGLKFEAFFHCAAEVNVNLCEKDFNHAIQSNCEYARFLFERVDANFNFFISTDSVYEGKTGNYKETDETKPVNNYAMSKLKGENTIRKIVDNLYVIRTNIIGDNSKNNSSLFEWANRELIRGKTINGFSNIYFNPLSVQHLSVVLLNMLKEKIPFGIYNIGCEKVISKYDFLLSVAILIGVDPSLIVPTEYIPSSEYAQRPMNTSVNCNKIKNHIKNLDLSLHTSLQMLIQSKNEKN